VANSFAKPSKDAHELYGSKMEAELVRTAVQKLLVGFRETILLREYEDLSYLEISGVVNCPVGAV
jgi:RNA polymerase sigma-70 factor, ECF subfamily